MKTYAPKPQDIERRWYVVDADGAVLGRLASEVAAVLRGKHKPIFAPHADTGDYVIVINARGIVLTGGKETKKVAYRHSGYPGGLKETSYSRLLSERPSFVVEKAVRGMLPHNRLGRAMAGKLSVYDGPDHPHRAQKPEALKLGEIPRWEGLPVRPVERAPKAERTEMEEKPAKAPRRSRAARPSTAKPKPAAKRSAAKRTATKATEKKPRSKKREE